MSEVARVLRHGTQSHSTQTTCSIALRASNPLVPCNTSPTHVRLASPPLTRLFFWLDLLFWFPFVGVINSAMPQFWAPEDTHQSDYLDVAENDSNTAFYVGLLGFLKMVGGLGEGGGAGEGVEEQVALRQGAGDSMVLSRNY